MRSEKLTNDTAADSAARETWMDATESLRRKLKVAHMIGAGFAFNHEGTVALEGLLTEMAQKLDLGVALQLLDGPSDA